MNLSRYYFYILKSFLNYLPSRLLVILNALFIIPFFAHILSKSEMGMYNLCVGLLALTCTVTSDWIAKTALRFYEKYKEQDNLSEFYSNLFIISIVSYTVIALVYFLFSDLIADKLYISKSLLFLTLLIIFPAGLRQFLYQMLRVFSKPFIYTASILLYQVSLLLLFLLVSGFIPRTEALLISMAASIVVVDIFILKKIRLMISMKLNWNWEFLIESLKYSIPTIVTNVSLWNILNLNKYIFQYNKDVTATAVTSLVSLFVSATITQIVSTFYFALFPVIVEKYEKKQDGIRDFNTKTMQLYTLIFMPIVGLFWYYPDMISRIVFVGSYDEARYLLPFFVTAIFIHELIKFINIKYHLSKKTYIEMLNALFSCIVSVGLNICLIKMYGILGAGIAILASFLLCSILNIFHKIDEVDCIDLGKFVHTIMFAIFIGLVVFLLLNFIMPYDISRIENLFKIPLFVLISYWFTWLFRFLIL